MGAMGARNVTQLLTWKKEAISRGGEQEDHNETQASQRKKGRQLGKPASAISSRKAEELTRPDQQNPSWTK